MINDIVVLTFVGYGSVFMSLKTVRRMAAQILGVGEKRVIFDPLQSGEISKAVTKDDVRKLIAAHAITVAKVKGVPRTRGRLRAERKRLRGVGEGKKHGTAKRRTEQKKRWMSRVRSQRMLLRRLREQGKLTKGYRKIYLKIKGGAFSDKSHMLTYLSEMGYLKK